MDLNRNIKQSPIIGVSGIGGGTASYILYGTKAGGGGYEISRSLRFNSADTAYLYLDRTGGPVGNRKTHTWSLWAKRSKPDSEANLFTGGTGSTDGKLRFNGDNTLQFNDGTGAQLNTTQVFRDYSAWYHIVLAYDSTQGTASNRIKLYINGEQVTEFSTETYPSPNADSFFSAAHNYYIGAQVHNNANLFDGYLAEVQFIDGQALTPTDFGEFDSNNVWQAKEYSGTYGTNGFHLTFSDNSNTTATTLGKDTSGQGNNWTPYNFSIAAGTGNDSLVDTPTNYGEDTGAGGEVRGNYSTLNPLFKLNTAATIVNGNLQTTGGDVAFSTMLLTSGKWYVECTVTGSPGYNLCLSQPDHPAGNTPSSTNSKSLGWYTTGGVYWGAGYDYSGSVSYTTGDVLAAAIDMDNTTITWYKNGSSVGNVINYSTGTYHRFAEGMLVSQFTGQSQWNFGQRAWANTSVPSGYKAMCTQNLPDPTIADGSKYVGIVTFTGSSSGGSFSVPNFAPNFIWSKNRASSVNHILQDDVRGFGNFGSMYSNLALGDLDGNNGGTNNIMSVSGSTVNYGTNNNFTGSMVSWSWDAGTPGANEVGSYWQPVYYTKYIGFKFETASGGRAVFGLASGTGTADIYTSSDNSSWTRVQTNVTLSTTDTTYDSSDQYLIVVNTSDATWSGYHYAMATNGTDGHYSTATYPGSGASFTWSGPAYSDWDFRSSGTVIKPGSISSGVPTIASTVRANPTAGFSIVNYVGSSSNTTVAHGLNSPAEMIIIKDRNNSYNWQVYHKDVGTTNALLLNGESAAANYSSWNSTAPTSQVFSVGAGTLGVNTNNANLIAYCFCGIESYSKFGKYTGNGLTGDDAPFVYTGFRPAWLLIKDTTSNYNWLIFDSQRNKFNIVNNVLHSNLSREENYSGAFDWLDFTSNGFKHRNNGLWHNTAGNTYVFAAFSEHPFKSSRAR